MKLPVLTTILPKKVKAKLHDNPLLLIKNLRVYDKNNNIILNNISLKLYENEIYGIVGETGSGKSILANLILGVENDFFIEKGEIILDGIDVTNFKRSDWIKSKLRGKTIGYFMQSNFLMLDPNLKIWFQIIEEELLKNKKDKNYKNKLLIKASDLLESFNFKNSYVVLNSYPHELSNFELRKIALLIIIFSKPKLIILDEIFMNLNLMERNEMIKILKLIQEKNNIGMIIISHDINLISELASIMGIIYKGSLVEEGKKEEIMKYPLHPYTWSLIMTIINEKNAKYFDIFSDDKKHKNFKNNDNYFSFKNEYSLKIDQFLKPPQFFHTNSHYVYSWIYDKNSPKNLEVSKLIQDIWNK
ncbi:MAG: hypothetical protein HPAVJP_5400 [Candidatus Hepatoplasma vulgare]|nr:MAG: hypothetical protein HPAVJP_5400 [Candidatus Hepatoplasma sp.]